jgi:DNA-binding response OmpR family regulator
VKVLVVDDDAHIRELVQMKLQGAGHEVITANDGEEGLARARNEGPGLVLLDIAMPKLTGLEVCEALRADPATANLPIVLITARSGEVDVERGFAAGADDYITKPFSPRELLHRLEAILERAG